MRRGKTEICIDGVAFIARKGLQKFFDLRMEFFQNKLLNHIDELTKKEVLGSLNTFPLNMI